MLVKDNFVTQNKEKDEKRSGNVFLEQKTNIRGDFEEKHPGAIDPLKPKVLPQPATATTNAQTAAETVPEKVYSDDSLPQGFQALLRQSRENQMGLLTPKAVTQFAMDAEDYRKRSVEQYQSMSWQEATDTNYQTARRQESANIAKRAGLVSDWLDANRGRLTQESYDFYKAYLSDFSKSQKDVDKAFSEKWNAISQYSSAEEYEKALRELPYYEKYGGMNYTQLRAEAQKLPKGEEKDWLDQYSQGHKTKDYYEAEKRRKESELEYLEKAQADYERLMHVPTMDPSEPGYAALKAEYDIRMPELENLNTDYLIEQKKTEIYHLDKSIQYEFLQDNPDFEVNSKYTGSAGNGTKLQQMVNNPETADLEDTATTVMKYVPGIVVPGSEVYARVREAWNYENVHLMTDEERKIFNYLHNTRGEAAAEEYMDWLQYQLNERSTKKLTDWVAEKTGSNVASEVLGSVLSTPIALLSGEGILDAAAQKIIRDFSDEYKPIDYNRDGMLASRASGTIRDTVAKDIYEHGGAGLAAVYNVGMGLQDSVAIAAAAKVNPALGKVAATLLSGAAATDTMLNAVERGATDDQAIGLGILSGAFEMIFEKYELDSLMSQSDDAIRATCKQALSEGVGEAATELSNMVADYVIMGKNSNWSINVQGYMDQRLSPEDAKEKAFLDAALQVGIAFGGGVVSGGAMGGGQAFIQNASAKSSIKSATAEAYGGIYAEAYRNDLPALVDSALKLDPQNAAALQVQKKLQAGEDISDAEILQLAKPVRIAATAGRRLQELGVDQDVEAVGNAIGKELSGQGLTSDEKALLKNHPQAQQVMDELRAEGRDERAYVKSLQQKAIDTYRKQRKEYARAQKKVDRAKYTEDAVASLMEGIEPVRRAPTARDESAGAISDLVDETVAQLTGAPSDPVKAAVEGFRTSGTVSNKQATDILNNAGAVEQLAEETGMVLPSTASGKRAAVKEAVARLSQSETVVDSEGDVGAVDAAPVPEASTAENANEAETTHPGESPETGSLATDKASASQDAAVVKDNPGHRQGDSLVTAPTSRITDGEGDVNTESVGAAPEGFTGKGDYYDLMTDDNAQPDRPGDVRPMEIPKTDANGKRVTELAANAYGSPLTSDYAADTVQELIMEGALGFDVKGHAQSLAQAQERIQRDGDKRVLFDIKEAVGAHKTTDEDIAAAILLYSKYAKSKDTQTEAAEILTALGEMANRTGRNLSLFALLRKMTGQGQLATLENYIRGAQRSLNRTRSKKKQLDVQIPQELKDKFLKAAQDEQNGVEGATDRKDEVTDLIFEYAASQMKATIAEKANAWRYMAMLGNPVTQARNILGNVAMKPMVGSKRIIGSVLEGLFLKKDDRTKSILVGKDARELKAWARADTNNAKEALMASGRTGDKGPNQILDQRQIYNNPYMEAVRNFVQLVPETMDMAFKNWEYSTALASFIKARGYTAADAKSGKIPEATLAQARSYAVQEALKATFNDCNALSDLLTSLGRRSNNRFAQAANLLVEGVLPFRKTPANILSRAIADYSIVGIGRGLVNLATKVKNGNMSAATAIDKIASGLTGTGLMALGWALGKGLLGIRLVGKLKDEDEKDSNRQSYALEIGDHSFSIDWAAPVCIPLFVGANLAQENEETDSAWWVNALNVCATSVEPMLELSCLSALNDLVEDAKYAEEGEAIYSIAASIATSYVSQFIPSAMGQWERALEEDEMKVYSDAESGVEKTWQRFIGGVSKKIPGWDAYQVKKYDDRGDDHATENRVNSIVKGIGLLPSDIQIIDSDAVHQEISRLNDEQDVNVSLPSAHASVSYMDTSGEKQERRLTHEEYETVSRVQGREQDRLLQELFASEGYGSLNDAQKAAAVQNVYAYAKEMAYQEAIADYQSSADSWMLECEGREVEAIVTHTVTSSLTKAMTAVANGGKDAVKAAEDAYETYAALPAETRMAVDKELGGRSEAFVAAAKAGVSAEAFGYLYGEYQQIDQSDLSASGKAQKWAYALDGAQKQGLITASQKQILKEGLKYHMTMAADSEGYDKMTAAGVSSRTADYVWDLLSGIEPEAGKTEVRDIQRLEAIVEDDRISDEDMKLLLPVYLSEEQQEDFETAMGQGYSPEDYVEAYRVVLDRQKGEKKNVVVRRMANEAGISYPAAKALYELFT